MPTISSIRSRYTGNRDSPVARVRLTTSSAVADACRALTFTRGVMTCCAVSSPRDRVRTKRSAVSCSRAPARAECRARETSSPGVRAEASSSAGSKPRARTRRLATAFSPAITGRNSRAKTCCGPATKRATCIGRDTAQFLGTSSPITIWTAEASSMPTTTETPGTAPSGRPMPVKGPCSSPARAGWASMPTTREVMVMPSCVPESWKDSSRRDSTTRRARRSPAVAACSASGRSTVTRPNSAATKNPLARISTNAAASSSRWVVMLPPPPDAREPGNTVSRYVGRGRRRYCRTIRPSPERVTPRVAGAPGHRAGRQGRRRCRRASAHQINQDMGDCGRWMAPVLPGSCPVRAAGPVRTGGREVSPAAFRDRVRSAPRPARAGRARRRRHAAWRCPAGCRARAGWCRR